MSTEADSAYQPPTDLKDRLATSYDIIAPAYNKWTTTHADTRTPWIQKLLNNLSSQPGEEIRILELGAGAGIPTGKAFLEQSPSVAYIANDLSAHQLQLLKENLATHKDRITTMPGDMLTLDVAPSSLAAVVGMYSLIHLPRQEQTQLLGQIATWLKPGGFLLANFAEEAAQEMINENWLGEGSWMYWSGWGVEGTVKMVKDAGLEVLEKEVVKDVVDANFLWLLARRKL